MPGHNPVFEHGPDTHEVQAVVKGGQLVSVGTGGKVKVAAATEEKGTVLGVATKDSAPVGTSYESTNVYGYPVTDASVPQQYTPVYYRGIHRLTFAANAAFGDPVKAAANGQVTPYLGTDTNTELIVGYCRETGGVTSGAKGKVLLSLQ